MGRAERRANAKALGVPGQVWTSRKAIQLDDPDGLDPAVLAASIVGALIEVHKAGGDPMLHSQVTIGSDHPDYPDMMIIEVVTNQARRNAAEELGAPLTLGGDDATT